MQKYVTGRGMKLKNIHSKVHYAQTTAISLSLLVFISFNISAKPPASDAIEEDAYVSNDSPDTKIPSVASSLNGSGLIDAGERQMNMIQAKIFSRQGLYQKSLHIYRSLLKDFPDDDGIWMDYIDTLVNFSDYDLALMKANRLIEQDQSQNIS